MSSQDLWWEYAKKKDHFDEMTQIYNYTIIIIILKKSYNILFHNQKITLKNP